MDIPIEVLVYLFKYLPHSDRAAASQTCRLWCEAACDSTFLNKECIYFIKNTLQDDTYPINIFEGNTIRKFINFSLRDMDMASKMFAFWELNGCNIKSLQFDQCDMQEKIFTYILNQSPNLEYLTVSNCRELFMSARFMEDDPDGLSKNSLKKLKGLNLSKNRYLSDALFNKLVAASDYLEKLDLSDCPVSFHSGLYKKFYPFGVNKDGAKTPSESVLTFHYVLEFLKDKGKNIKELSFNKTLIDGVALKLISELPDIQLLSLEVYACDQLNNEGLLTMTEHQTKLVKLDLGMCTRVTDQTLISICNNLLNLKTLFITRCRAITNVGVMEIRNLKKLRCLDISQCELITKDGISNGICKETNNVLQELNISALNLDESIVIMISEKLPNLTVLDMNFCFTSVTDISIQSVFKNLLNLRSLEISHCEQVSDAGLTGMGTGKQDHTLLQDLPIKSAVQPVEKYHRISLRSRAEEQIVNDARRKKDVREMCENISGDSVEGYSMVRLKNLQYLDISGCNRITDVSLIYAFHYAQLKALNLTECQQITCEGLNYLASNCPCVETVELVNCYNTRDAGVENLVTKLHRLKHLHLRGCNLLTDASLYAIKSNCKILKFLDIQGCRNISPDLAQTLTSLPTLHTLLISKPGPYITDGLKQRMPPAPPLPTFGSFRNIIF